MNMNHKRFPLPAGLDRSTLGQLPESLIAEDGGGFGFVCIWRLGVSGDSARECAVGEFLSRPENQSGAWLIDGGWGSPPGPIQVRWNGVEWENRGHSFPTNGIAP
jgi:hypothetical protein